MDFGDLFDSAHDGAFFKLIGTKIQDTLREHRQSRPEENARRWGWELLQNAKDVAFPDRPVRVRFCLTEDASPRLVAQHSGSPFRPDQLYYLIVQTSTKERPADGSAPATTGRYGTGFLTTHLLSPVVEVSGVLEAPDTPPAQFSVTLDRSGGTLDELTEAVKQALSVRESFGRLRRLDRMDPDAYNTVFSYALDEGGLDVARRGIDDLMRSVPLTLAFTPSVGEVEVQGVAFRCHERQPLGEGVERVCVTSKRATAEDGPSALVETERHWFVVGRGERTSVAMRLDGGSRDARLLPLGDEVPRLFCDFPLLGSETFPLPFAVNSPSFYPDEARSGIYLEDEKDPNVQVNRSALAEVNGLLGRLLAVMDEEGWRDRYHLTAFGVPQSLPKRAAAWYADAVLAPARRTLLVAPLVETPTGAFRPLRKSLSGKEHGPAVWLPQDSSAEVRGGLWRFAMASPTLRDRLPKEADVHRWSALAWSDCGTLDPSILVSRVSSSGNVASLASTYEMQEDEAVRWLGAFVGFLVKHGHKQLLGPHMGMTLYAMGWTYQWKRESKQAPILPNQHGTFCLKGALYLDGDLDEELKDIAADLGHDIRAVLLHRDVFLEERHVKGTKTPKELAQTIEAAVKERVKGTRTEEARRAFRALYLWIKEHDAAARELFGLWLYEHRALLVPPEDVLDLMDRVPVLEKENAVLREEQATLQAERAAVEAERQGLLRANEALRSDADHYRELQAWLQAEGIEWSALPELLEGRKELAERRETAGHDDPIAQLVRELHDLQIVTVDELEAYVRAHPDAFQHLPDGTVGRYLLFRQKAERAQAAVKAHLETLPQYDLARWQVCPDRPTVVLGVDRRDRTHGRPLLLVVRPSDGGRVIFYYEEELAALSEAEAELWIEDPHGGVRQLTLGRLLQGLRDRMGVNQVPVS